MLNGVFTILKPGGNFLLQILNYDYIVGEQLSELPTIETENIKFIRTYKFRKNTDLIDFQTELHLKKSEEIISNETTLLALKSSDLQELLDYTGFKDMQFYADFKKSGFGAKHLPLVVSCRK